MIALLLSFFIHGGEYFHEFDLIEKNHVINSEGQESIEQWIFWNWNESLGCFQVSHWAVSSKETIFESNNSYKVLIKSQIFKSRLFRETFTNYDPELLDRFNVPTDQRKKLVLRFFWQHKLFAKENYFRKFGTFCGENIAKFAVSLSK